MIFIDTNQKQRDLLYSECKIEKVIDRGVRSSLYKRMSDKGEHFNTFITNFNEEFNFQPYNLDTEGFYTWKYDVVTVPLKSVSKICRLLKIEEGNVLKKRF